MKKNAHIAPPIKYFPASSKWYNKTRKGIKHIQMEDTKLFSFEKKNLTPHMENFNCKNTQLLKAVVGKISFHSNAKEGQCQRMFKLPKTVQLHSFHMLEGNAQNPLS